VTGRRRGTATSAFGVGRRENHDATDFYARFAPPAIVNDEAVNPAPKHLLDRIYQGDARSMDLVPDNSVALVVTSPPYFAGKEYEAALGQGHIPSSYLEYLQMLEDVFAECARTLEPGGRIAVNVANLGRRPYRSLAADVTTILQDRLGLLLRGEIVWQKARGATGSTAWGSFQSASNPVLRDVSERVIIAGKHRFDRAVPRPERAARGLPSVTTMNKDEFMEATLDVWEMAPESAARVNHPAPFPVELPLRLIHLYTFQGDLVLDPFMGSGTTAVAAIQADRHFVGYDTDRRYVLRARRRAATERARRRTQVTAPPFTASLAVTPAPPPDEGFQQRAVREGRAAKEIAELVLTHCGFRDIRRNVKLGSGVEVNLVASDATGEPWYFDISGAFTSTRPGLRRSDTVWKALGKVAVLRERNIAPNRIILLSTDLPAPRSAGDKALRSLEGTSYRAVFDMLAPEAHEQLAEFARGDRARRPGRPRP
jgi:DNA modification methylase